MIPNDRYYNVVIGHYPFFVKRLYAKIRRIFTLKIKSCGSFILVRFPGLRRYRRPSILAVCVDLNAVQQSYEIRGNLLGVVGVDVENSLSVDSHKRLTGGRPVEAVVEFSPVAEREDHMDDGVFFVGREFLFLLIRQR